MPIKLLDPNHTEVIDVDGTLFHVKQLMAAETIILAQAISKISTDGDDYNDDAFLSACKKISGIFKSRIVKIEDSDGRDIDAGELVYQMADPVQLATLVAKMLEISKLDEGMEKNL